MRYIKIALLAACLYPHFVKAQVDAGALRQQIEKQIPDLNPLPLPGPTKGEEKSVDSKSEEVKVLVKEFRFTGVSRISEVILQEALTPWIGQFVSLTELKKAADIVVEVYRRNNLLAQAFIPPQKIDKDGVVLISVLEAKLGAVKVDGQNDSPRFSIAKVEEYITFANPIGGSVDTQAIERVIYILNEIPGLAVTTSIEPGDNDGDVTLRVLAADTPLFKGRAELNNYGSRSTGVAQSSASLYVNNPNGYGDQISLNGLYSEGSHYSSLSYSLPIDQNGWRVGFSTSYLDYETLRSFAGTKGYSNTLGINATYPIIRSQLQNLNISFTHDQKSYRNHLVSSGVPTSHYQIKNYGVNLSGNRYDGLWGGGISSASLSLISGRFSSESETPDYGARNNKQFTKISYLLSRNQQVIPDSTVLNISVSGQFASTNLDSAEKFYLGGPNGVRSYPNSQGGGDQGLIVNFEVQHQLPERVVGYAFLDIGFIQQYKNKEVYSQELINNRADNTYSLSGIGVGAKYNYLGINLSGSIAWRLGHNPYYIASNGQYVQKNNDNTSRTPYLWLQANYLF